MKINYKYVLGILVVVLICGTCIYAVKEVRDQEKDYRASFRSIIVYCS